MPNNLIKMVNEIVKNKESNNEVEFLKKKIASIGPDSKLLKK